ncbi:MAG: MATE family efflux transporter [Gemmatimonadetes bacterium]|nr:MATE family efflux transporter [Gemmatimonadota bacterium]
MSAGPPTNTATTKGRATFDRDLIDGPLLPAVWRIAWPTMLQNLIGGLQGVIDHAMVGHYVGYAGNAAIGISLQIYLVVIAFISSLFIGMSVLVARFAGAGDEDRVNRTVLQAFLVAVALSIGVLAPVGYFAAPTLLQLVNAAPNVQVEALPYLRIMFLFGMGMLLFYMVGGALRSAGDARTPLRLGIIVTVANIVLNVILIRGLGPIPAFGTTGAAMGTALATGAVGVYAGLKLWRGGWVVRFPRGDGVRLEWDIILALFRFGLPSGVQGVAMNLGGAMMLGFVGSLALSGQAQAAYAVSYTELFAFITWTSAGLTGAVATVAGQSLGSGNPDRAARSAFEAARIAVAGAAAIGLLFLFIPRTLLGLFGMTDPVVLELGAQLLRYLSVSGIFIAVGLTYTGGLQGTGDTRSPLYISLVSQLAIPLGICFFIQRFSTLEPSDIWRAIVAGHITRCVLSVWRFTQGKWRSIEVHVGAARR